MRQDHTKLNCSAYRPSYTGVRDFRGNCLDSKDTTPYALNGGECIRHRLVTFSSGAYDTMALLPWESFLLWGNGHNIDHQ